MNPELNTAQKIKLEKTVADYQSQQRGIGHDDAVFSRSMPSFSVGPESYRVPAAFLIELCGFQKGECRDQICISENHILALTNRGGSTAALLSFSESIKSRVKEVTGIQLHREPVYHSRVV